LVNSALSINDVLAVFDIHHEVSSRILR